MLDQFLQNVKLKGVNLNFHQKFQNTPYADELILIKSHNGVWEGHVLFMVFVYFNFLMGNLG